MIIRMVDIIARESLPIVRKDEMLGAVGRDYQRSAAAKPTKLRGLVEFVGMEVGPAEYAENLCAVGHLFDDDLVVRNGLVDIAELLAQVAELQLHGREALTALLDLMVDEQCFAAVAAAQESCRFLDLFDEFLDLGFVHRVALHVTDQEVLGDLVDDLDLVTELLEPIVELL